MLQGASKWLVYLVLTSIAILVLLALIGQAGVVQDLKLRIAEAKSGGWSDDSLFQLGLLHRRFAGLLILSFFGFMLFITGVVILMQYLRDAYNLSEVQEKVREAIKKATPGIVMLTVGGLFLSMATYGYAYLERKYSKMLGDLPQIAQQGPRMPDTALPKTSAPVVVDTMLPVLANKQDAKHKDKTKSDKKHVATATPEVKKAIVAKAEKKWQNPKGAQKASIPMAVTKKPDSTPQAAVPLPPDTLKAAKAAEVNTTTAPAPVTESREKDIQWARKHQREVLVYGRIPSRADAVRYDSISRRYGGELNSGSGDLHWAYNLAIKATEGYQPTPEELQAYEKAVYRVAKKKYQ